MRNSTISATVMVFAMALCTNALADPRHNLPGASGYDLVSYHTAKRPARGSGHFTSNHDGVTYLFASSQNKSLFDANPVKYLPAYGGFCAFGVSVGKKFAADPEVWRIVDGKLYLNLDANIQDDWLRDVPGRIAAADRHWQQIGNTPVALR